LATILTHGFYHAWLLNVVGAQRDRADKLLGSAADTLPTQHLMAQITKSLLQATPCGVKRENADLKKREEGHILKVKALYGFQVGDCF